jgi:hypothetical protein
MTEESLDPLTESRFAAACNRPFANGTEGEAWEAKWCRYCANDHTMHGVDPLGPGCGLWAAALIHEWPEGWIPEPDDGKFYLPSRLVCLAFTPCEPCGGDPGAGERAERLAEVTEYWKSSNG